MFDAVMVCMGHHIESFIPEQSFPGKSCVCKTLLQDVFGVQVNKVQNQEQLGTIVCIPVLEWEPMARCMTGLMIPPDLIIPSCLSWGFSPLEALQLLDYPNHYFSKQMGLDPISS